MVVSNLTPVVTAAMVYAGEDCCLGVALLVDVELEMAFAELFVRNRNVLHQLLNPFRYNQLLDPLSDLYLWKFLYFHLFHHKMKPHVSSDEQRLVPEKLD